MKDTSVKRTFSFGEDVFFICLNSNEIIENSKNIRILENLTSGTAGNDRLKLREIIMKYITSGG